MLVDELILVGRATSKRNKQKPFATKMRSFLSGAGVQNREELVKMTDVKIKRLYYMNEVGYCHRPKRFNCLGLGEPMG